MKFHIIVTSFSVSLFATPTHTLPVERNLAGMVSTFIDNWHYPSPRRVSTKLFHCSPHRIKLCCRRHSSAAEPRLCHRHLSFTGIADSCLKRSSPLLEFLNHSLRLSQSAYAHPPSYQNLLIVSIAISS